MKVSFVLRIKNSISSFLRRVLRWMLRHYQDEFYEAWSEIRDGSATAAFGKTITKLGPRCSIRHPFYLHGPEHIQIGGDFYAGPGLRLEAWDDYFGQKHNPSIKIGDNVVFNNDVHIGAIGKMEIGNDVMVGSRVLITDHSHGRLTAEELRVPARLRPLFQKGEVIIEDNVWIGEGACILSGVRVGQNAVIGANAVVAADVAPNTIVGGVPARMLRRIDSSDK